MIKLSEHANTLDLNIRRRLIHILSVPLPFKLDGERCHTLHDQFKLKDMLYCS